MKTETTEQQPRCFRIIRFYRNGRKPRTIKNGLSEAEAQEHCSREDTHGPGWFNHGLILAGSHVGDEIAGVFTALDCLYRLAVRSGLCPHGEKRCEMDMAREVLERVGKQ